MPNEKYKQKSIYLLHYPRSDEVKYSNGVIKYIENNNKRFLIFYSFINGRKTRRIYS